MANGFYSSFKQRLLNKEIDMDTDVIKASLIDNGVYTVNLGTHGSVATDAPTRVADSGQLTGPTITNGVFDTNDFSWTAVSGAQSESIILWDDTHANDAMSVYYDTLITGMPVTPNGGNINVTVNASGWFAL